MYYAIGIDRAASEETDFVAFVCPALSAAFLDYNKFYNIM
jgi:hypothetical protein